MQSTNSEYGSPYLATHHFPLDLTDKSCMSVSECSAVSDKRFVLALGCRSVVSGAEVCLQA